MESHTRQEQVVLVMESQTPKTHSLEAEFTKEHISTTTSPQQQQQLRHRPPKPPSKTLTRLAFSKPKARFADPPTHPHKPTTTTPDPDTHYHSDHTDTYADSSSGWSSDDEETWSKEHEEEDDDDDHSHRHRKKKNNKKKKLNWRVVVEWVLFITITTCLICSLTITSLKKEHKWGHLEIWKWCLIVLVIFCGRLVSGWVMATAVFFIERNFMLREKVLYFVYGLRKSIQNCVWLGLVLLAWTFMFSEDVDKKNQVLRKFFKALVAVQIGATIWLVKIILVKMLASSFHVTTYFDRMKESVFHHYILETLSGPPAEDIGEGEAHLAESKSMSSATESGRRWRKKKRRAEEEEEREWSNYKMKRVGTRRIDMDRLRKLSMKRRGSAWSVKRLVSYVMSTGLSTISKTVDDFGKAESEISSEWEARSCAQRIFKNVAKPGAKYIEEEDLLRFLKRIEVHTIFPLFEGALETGNISKSSFRNWVVRAYLERKSLAHSLNDTKTAVQQLHKLASAIVIVIIIVVTLLVMELATSKVILFVTTQLILGGVIFQGIFKTLIESIILVFVMHPFDIGDRCVIDGVQMIVEEMNILTTVFLRYDNEKIYYPNSVLLTKPISNFYRSPEMSDWIEFTLDVSTSVETIVAVKKAIQEYIESKPKYWNPKHSVIAKKIENMDKLTMGLAIQHTINHQNYGERNTRISELIMELKKIFESLGVEYNLLPQEVRLSENNKSNWRMPLRS